ncbi:hypothetical protein HZC53_00035 [Candidatus Uhrbacteria bacterium]|nr:hypothetical protein [Candidatus Uhrbacteria bacterium]
MTKQLALKILLAVGLGGMAFSGYLTYLEMFTKTLTACPAPGAAGTILGYPACVYGFVMYLAIVTVALFGLNSKK